MISHSFFTISDFFHRICNGRVVVKNRKVKIKPIDNNQQSENKLIALYEENVRKMYRKWDNIKHISEEIKERRIPRKAYDSGLWGLKMSPQNVK